MYFCDPKKKTAVHTICLDKLEVYYLFAEFSPADFARRFCVTGDSTAFTTESFYFESTGPVNSWRSGYDVFCRQCKLGRFYYNSRLAGQRDKAIFIFEDIVFYQRDFSLYEMSLQIAAELGLMFLCYSAVDIAFDTDEDLFFPNTKLYPNKLLAYSPGDHLTGEQIFIADTLQYLSRERAFNRSCKSAAAEVELHTGRKYFNTLYFGKRQSRCALKFYNKTKELQEVHEKEFIKNVWRRAGWAGGRVWRCEISLHHLAGSAKTMMYCDTLLNGSAGCGRWVDDQQIIESVFYELNAKNFTFVCQCGGCKSKTQIVDCQHYTIQHNINYVTIEEKQPEKQPYEIVKNNSFTSGCKNYLRKLSRDTELSFILTDEEREILRKAAAIFGDIHEKVKFERNGDPPKVPPNNYFDGSPPPPTEQQRRAADEQNYYWELQQERSINY